MLLTILKMPNVYSPDVDTRSPMATSQLMANMGLLGHGHPDNLILGTLTDHFPGELYKAFYLNPGDSCIVEVVYEKVDGEYICLYAKVIGDMVDVIASRVGVEQYIRHGRERGYHSLGELVARAYFMQNSVTIAQEFRDILPILYTEEDITDCAYQLVGTFSGDFPIPQEGSLVNRLYRTYPHILQALSSGQFTKAPEHHLVQHHPYIQIKPAIWSLAESSQFANEVASGRVIVNDPAFHEVVRQLICMRPGALRVTYPLSIESACGNALRINNRLEDPYIWALPLNERGLNSVNQDLDRISMSCIRLYCQLNGLDPAVFDQEITNSAITIEKTLYDEVMINVHDLVHDRFVQYYSYFPITVLGTKALGYIL